MMFLSPVVRKALDSRPKERIFYVRVQDFVKEYGIKSKNYYSELEKIADTILAKAFFFWYDTENSKAKKGVSWVSECDYLKNEGILKIKLDDTVIEMLTVFDKANPFTKYERQMIVNLGSYGIILFELISSCMHQQHKQKTYSIEYLREKFNCVDKYNVISEFKRNVLDTAISDIHQHTPYRITYNQVKTGRQITGFIFTFKQKPSKATAQQIKRDDTTGDLFSINNMSDKQIAVFSKKLAELPELGSKYCPVGASVEQFANMIADELKNPLLKVKYIDYLKKVGFKQVK